MRPTDAPGAFSGRAPRARPSLSQLGRAERVACVPPEPAPSRPARSTGALCAIPVTANHSDTSAPDPAGPNRLGGRGAQRPIGLSPGRLWPRPRHYPLGWAGWAGREFPLDLTTRRWRWVREQLLSSNATWLAACRRAVMPFFQRCSCTRLLGYVGWYISGRFRIDRTCIPGNDTSYSTAPR